MRLDSTCNASARQDTEKAYQTVHTYRRAISCARFSPVEIMLVEDVFTHGWCEPRFTYGESKVSPIDLSPSEIARTRGYDRSRIHDALKSLRQGNVLLQDEDGLWRLNPRWRDWMRPNGALRIHLLCRGYVENGRPRNHHCPNDMALEPVAEEPHGVVAVTQQQDATQVAAMTCDLVADPPQPTGNHVADPPQSASRAISPHARPEDLLCILPSIGKVTEVSLNVCVNSLVPSAQVAQAQELDRAEPFSHTHTQESETTHAFTEAPGEEKTPDLGQLDGLSSQEAPNPNPTPEILPAVHPNNHAHTHPENAERVARYGSSFEGKCTPDPERLAVARKLVEDHMGGNDGIVCGIGLNKFRYPSAWIVKALKRTIATKRNEQGHCPVRNFRYVEMILAGWKDAEGPESGPEDAFDDSMQLLPPKPKGAKVPDAQQPAQPELTTEEKSKKFAESFAQLYPHLVGPVPANTSRYRGPEPEGYVPVFRTSIEPIPAGRP